jgi:glycine dehydrogenase
LIEGTSERIKKIKQEAVKKEINFRYIGNNRVGVSLNEIIGEEDILELIELFAGIAGKQLASGYLESLLERVESEFAEYLPRITSYLTHKVFNSYQSETEMLRFLKKLENKDLSLAHSMTPLGSCTMKLNATTELLGITWPEFSNIHPFAPANQTKGYKEIILELEEDLKEITGLAAVSS